MGKSTIKAAALAVLVGLAAAPAVGATHSAPCPHVQYFPADSQDMTYPVYVTLDAVHSNGYVLASSHVYVESNGHDGLQRDDDYCYTEGIDESTRDMLLVELMV